MLFREFTLASADKLNERLHNRFQALVASGATRQTHFFAGRFENIYIDKASIPEITEVLNVFKQQAAEWLDRPVSQLKAGFWFNAMEAGHSTAPHHHDENDELLSAVYYIQVPPLSGELVLGAPDGQISIQPEAGKLVMFPPGLLHEVTTHRGTGLRLSVGMNVGPVDT